MKEPGELKVKKFERDGFRPERRRIIGKEKEIPGMEEKLEEELQKVREKAEGLYPKPKEEEPEIKKEGKTSELIEKILEPWKIEREKKIGRGTIETRQEAIKEILGVSKEFRDLVGIDSPGAWDKRKRLLETKNPRIIKEVLGTLAGLPDSLEVWKILSPFLKDIDKNQPYRRTLCEALIGKTSKAAEEMRNGLEFADPETKKLRGGNWLEWINRFGLQKSEGFFKLRKEIDKRVRIGWFLPSDVVLSEMGINTPEANKRRTAYKDTAPVETLISTAGIKPGESPEVDAIRRELALDFRLRGPYDLAVKGNNYEKS